MFGINKVNKELLKEIKAMRRDIRDLKTQILNSNFGNVGIGTNTKAKMVEKPKTKAIEIPTTKKLQKKGKGMYRYYENNIDNLELILKPSEQAKADNSCNYCNSYTASVMASLIKRGYSLEKISKLVNVQTNTLRKYCFYLAGMGYFLKTRVVGDGHAKTKFSPNMKYFDENKG